MKTHNSEFYAANPRVSEKEYVDPDSPENLLLLHFIIKCCFMVLFSER